MKAIKYTAVLKAEISESDFAALLQQAQPFPAALRNFEAAASGGTSLRVFLADAAKICGSDFRPRNW